MFPPQWESGASPASQALLGAQSLLLQRLQEDSTPPPRSPSDPQKSWGRVVQPPGFSRADGEVLIELGASLFHFLHLSSVILPLTVNEDVGLGGSQVESGEDLALVILPERLLGERTPRVSPNS